VTDRPREGYATLTARVTAKDRADFAAVADVMGLTPSGLLARFVRTFVERKAGVMAKIGEIRRLRNEIDDAVDRAVDRAMATSGTRRARGTTRNWAQLDEVLALYETGDVDGTRKLIAAQEPHIARNLRVRLEAEHPEVWKGLGPAMSTNVDTNGRRRR
jgi:hypothetical protein